MGARLIIGIDLGGTNLKAGLLNSKYRILEKKLHSTQRFTTKEDLISAIIRCIRSLMEGNGLRPADILGIGAGLPGPVDQKKGIVHFFPNIPGWKEVNLKKILQKKTGIPVAIDNDAKLMCLAEYKIGMARGARNALCVTLGTGVGGGIILEGKLYRGCDNAAGEVGHLAVNLKGPRCNCGGVACLESYIGNKRILKAARKTFKRDISLEELSILARKGNKKALDIWSDVGQCLGAAFSSLVNVLNLEVIVVGGGVAQAGGILFRKIRQTIQRRAMSVQSKRIRLIKAKLGSDAGLIGAAILVREGA
jgi:glucokinase